MNLNIILNLAINYVFDLDEKLKFTEKITNKIKNCAYHLFNKKFVLKKKEVSDYDIIAEDMNLELNFLSVLIYIVIITINYYNNCEISIIDCMGRPTISSGSSNNNYPYILIALLVWYLIIRYLSRLFFMRIFKIKDEGHIISMNGCFAKTLFIVSIYGQIINWGIPGLYSILNLNL